MGEHEFGTYHVVWVVDTLSGRPDVAGTKLHGIKFCLFYKRWVGTCQWAQQHADWWIPSSTSSSLSLEQSWTVTVDGQGGSQQAGKPCSFIFAWIICLKNGNDNRVLVIICLPSQASYFWKLMCSSDWWSMLLSDFSRRIYPLYSHILPSFSVLPNENALLAKGRKKSITYTALPLACFPPCFVSLSLL